MGRKNASDDNKMYLYVPLPEDVHKKLKVKSAMEGIPMAQWVSELVARELSNISLATDSIGPCPLCGSAVTEGSKSYSCTNWRRGCKFLIWKEIAHRQITPSEASALLDKGYTGLLAGFKSKANKEFAAALAIQGSKTVFVFETDRKPPVAAEEEHISA